MEGLCSVRGDTVSLAQHINPVGDEPCSKSPFNLPNGPNMNKYYKGC